MSRSGEDIAVRPLVAERTADILRAIMRSTDHGVMLTDLDHTAIACNARFGELFGVDIDRVVNSDVAHVRKMVRRLIPDMAVWEQNLEKVYADPRHVQEDELVLLHSPPKTVHRYTGPVLDRSGEVSGRLWTFKDVTRESRLKAMRELLYEVSTQFSDDPRTAYQRVVQAVARFYGSNAILSIRNGDFMEFRAVASRIPGFSRLKGNDLKKAYCQYSIDSGEPVLIQNARLEGRGQDLLPAKLGFTRYVGVPVNEPGGGVIGTLCFLDGHSHSIVDEEDLRFMSLLAMRVSAELARESYILERVAEKQKVVEAQSRDLETTRSVLSAMNSGFGLLASTKSLDKLVKFQVALLGGLLDYCSAGLLLDLGADGRLSGFTVSDGQTEPRAVELSGRLGTTGLFPGECQDVIPLRHLPRGRAFLILATKGGPAERGARHEAHLEALVEQVSLVLAAFLLQKELAVAYEELRNTHQKLVQSEKLSVVGTLAASTAHDIKNILSSITLELGFGGEDPGRALEAVRGHLDRFSVLSHRLLSYAKPRLVATQPLDLDDLVQKVLALTSAHTRVAGVTVQWERATEPPMVQGDPNQLEHLFVNLVLNAVQAMHDQGGVLSIRMKTSRGYVETEVSDTGKGISEKVLSQLFEPFVSTRAEGFGLGLYSAKRIVEGHGGHIRVKSKLGKGTTFRVQLRAGRLRA